MLNRFLNPVARVAFGLVSLSVSIIFLTTSFGLFPDNRPEMIRSRQALCESIAVSFSSMANRIDESAMKNYFSKVAKRHPEIKTIGLRGSNGDNIFGIGNHFETWSLAETEQANDRAMFVPIFDGNRQEWGRIEIQFGSLGLDGWSGFIRRPENALAMIFGVVGFVAFYLYLRFVLKQLNPSRVVPRRVRDALDSLAEGLVVMDSKERIVLANKAFQKSTGFDLESLLGKQVNTLPFAAANTNSETPWQTALENGDSVRGKLMRGGTDSAQSTYLVSCAPILDDEGKNRGAIASFEDVTQLERKTVELEQMFHELDASTREIKRQNRELEFLATRDPLTGCMNRRSFFKIFDQQFAACQSSNTPLSAFMVDIDHFKSINDNHGHAVGDQVLKLVAETLEKSTRRDDIVCRYGGEEFSVLLPNTNIDSAAVVAENLRQELEALVPADIKVTASLGLSSLADNASSPQDLLEYADQCLYVAKRNGRNQVVRWDKVDPEELTPSAVTNEQPDDEELESQIPFRAVTALISALAFRDQETANHGRRVADLCVAVGEGLLSMKECYTLEIAGLLHDIGKIGVPDSILLKPEEFTEDEWKIMRHHERCGVDLIKTTFCSDSLNEIIANCRVTHIERTESSRTVSIGARILNIVDAYDSMTTEKSYRPALSTEEAFSELRRCAGQQFDPQLVERVIQILKVRGTEFTSSRQEVSKSAALNIGLQLERLAEAVDDRDQASIGSIASRLGQTATKHGAHAIAVKAREIAIELDDECELYDLIRCANELMTLCRSSQRTLVNL